MGLGEVISSKLITATKKTTWYKARGSEYNKNHYIKKARKKFFNKDLQNIQRAITAMTA